MNKLAQDKRFLLFGGGGMLGGYIKRVLENEQQTTVISFSSKECDITKIEVVHHIFTEFKPDFIIHAAAFCDTKGCESNPQKADTINIRGTEIIAENAYKYNTPLLFIGSDYVFDGEKGAPYLEEDPANPLNHYAYTKMRGEEIARGIKMHYIIRPSVIFGIGKLNIVNDIASLSSGVKPLPTDKVRRPTYALDLAGAIINLINTNPAYGTYHVANGGYCDNYQLGVDILTILGKPHHLIESLITPCLIADLSQYAKVAKTIIIDDSKWTRAGLPPLRPYKEALREYLLGEFSVWGPYLTK